MKATCIVGSARANGSTSYLADMFIKGFTECGGEAVKYCLSECDIRYCIGCKHCYTDGRCVIDDDVSRIVRRVLDSDVVLIATPSYWADVPGQLKTYFDRNTPYGDTNLNRVLTAKKRIRGIGIAVRAGKSERENELILDFIDHYFGHLGIEPTQRFSVREVDTFDDLTARHQDVIMKIYQLGYDFASL